LSSYSFKAQDNHRSARRPPPVVLGPSVGTRCFTRMISIRMADSEIVLYWPGSKTVSIKTNRKVKTSNAQVFGASAELNEPCLERHRTNGAISLSLVHGVTNFDFRLRFGHFFPHPSLLMTPSQTTEMFNVRHHMI
jgi:hypothetical protein